MSDPRSLFVVAIYNVDAENKKTIVGTGILVTPKLVLTCAHVVADALSLDRHSPLPSGAIEKIVTVAVAAITEDDREEIGAKIVEGTWHEVIADQGHRELQDAVLLELLHGVKFPFLPTQWERVRESTPVKFFGFGRETLDEGEWIEGQYQGPTSHWHQIDCASRNNEKGKEEVEFWPGFSGSPIFDRQGDKVIGMLVGYRDNRVVYMTHVSKLEKILQRKSAERITSEICEVLPYIIDRKDHRKIVKEKSASFHCYVVQCTNNDAPEPFAYGINLYNHLEKMGFKKLNRRIIESISIYLEAPLDGSFKDALMKTVDIKSILLTAKIPTVIYVNMKFPKEIDKYVQSIIAGLKHLDKDLRELPKECRTLIVILPYYLDLEAYGKLDKFFIKRKVKKMNGEFCTILPPLSPITRGHLESYIGDLPDAARADFNQVVRKINIEGEIKQLIPLGQNKQLGEIMKEFSQFIQQRIS